MTKIARLKTAACALLAGAGIFAAAAAHAQQDADAPINRVPAAREGAETTRVFGGREAASGAYPFQVALLASGRLDESPDSQIDAQFCGGSLIAPGWVLTAAHCIVDHGEPVPAHLITALVGATALDEGERYEVAEVIAYPDYDDTTLDHDIALLRLAREADATAIGMTRDDIETGAATVVGWGLMENGYFPVNLMEAEIELTGNAACNAGIKEIYARDLGYILQELAWRMRYSDDGVDAATAAIAATMRDPLTENMLCAGRADGVRDACNGDSGGPLFSVVDGEPVQVGIVSWGEGPMAGGARCGHANAYGVYTRLARYQDWIAEKTGN